MSDILFLIGTTVIYILSDFLYDYLETYGGDKWKHSKI